jgi:hypothetical protein
MGEETLRVYRDIGDNAADMIRVRSWDFGSPAVL